MMEHKFGVFQTVGELNRAAAAQKEEGDIESLKALAAENGFEEEDVEDYLDGTVDVFCTPYTAAWAKLKLEEKELDLKSQLLDWAQEVEEIAMGSAEFSNAVFNPEKKLADVIAKALEKASKERIRLSDELTRAAGIPTGTCIGMVSKKDVGQIAISYYTVGGDTQ